MSAAVCQPFIQSSMRATQFSQWQLNQTSPSVKKEGLTTMNVSVARGTRFTRRANRLGRIRLKPDTVRLACGLRDNVAAKMIGFHRVTSTLPRLPSSPQSLLGKELCVRDFRLPQSHYTNTRPEYNMCEFCNSLDQR